ncbi:hypothetical protein BKA59DRAFT_506786 [Fusarium tricinctum]|uniref:Uncharacterized protein n=2 Tax=Fusarium tricinctum species complex TaxID=679429 RepID=A0A8K0SBQ0_9HYPO|nr:hypothetical protein BKA59DRAFT_506786 [Fusarium tricinctum]
MLHSRLFASAMALFLGAQGALALNHGEVTEFDGKNVRWQELAKGIFTGVPEDKWDEKLHKRSNVEWDLDEIVANSTLSTRSDVIQLDSRDLQGTCRAAGRCVVYGSQYVLLLAYNTWISAAEYAAGGTVTKDLMDFLNQPFVANAAGVAVAGVISGQINEATKKECSTKPPETSQADIVRSAVEAVIDKNTEAQDVSIDVTGPSGAINIKIKAGPPNTSPSPDCKQA